MLKFPKLDSLREVVGLVWTQATPFVRRRLSAALLLLVIASVLTALGPVALKLVIDKFAGQSNGHAVSAVLLIGLYVLSQFLSRAIGEIRGLVYARAERRMFRTLSERLFSHVMHLPLRFHVNRQTGAISQTLDNGLQGYQLVLHHLIFTVLPVLAELGTVVVVLLGFNYPEFLALFCAAIVCYTTAFSFFAIRIAKAADTASTAHVASTAAMTDAVLNYETVKFFAAEHVVQDRLSQALMRTEDEWVGFFRRYAYNGLGVAAIYATFLAAAVLYAAHQVQQGRMTIGDFVLVNTYMLQVIRPVEMLGYAMQGFSQGMAMLRKMLELFHEQTEPMLTQDKEPLSGPGALRFDQVTLSYNPDRVVLKDVSFTLPAGKTLGVVGASGAGKSTIVRLLVRLYEPDSGRILLDGIPISELSLSQLRRAVAVVPQDTILFNDTIGYNIGFGRFGATQNEIEQAARLAQLHDFIMSLPERYETKVGERGVKLSGGERQRVSIARAALKRPRIYVFDEATSSLDSRTEQEILGNLREISKASTTLIIAHRLSTVVHSDEIIVLGSGTVLERGAHSQLLEHDGAYAALWQAQQREEGQRRNSSLVVPIRRDVVP
jgi:ATP-binding cassette subfamily B protein